MSHCKCSVETCSPSCGECGNPIKDCSPFSSRAAGDADDLAAEVMRLQGELAEARAAGEMNGQWYAEGVSCALCGEDSACRCCDSCKCDHDSEGRIKPDAAGEMPVAVAKLIKSAKIMLYYAELWKQTRPGWNGNWFDDTNQAKESIAAVESLYPRAGQEETK